jgi:membrane protease YdiL (CAAX protease family)
MPKIHPPSAIVGTDRFTTKKSAWREVLRLTLPLLVFDYLFKAILFMLSMNCQIFRHIGESPLLYLAGAAVFNGGQLAVMFYVSKDVLFFQWLRDMFKGKGYCIQGIIYGVGIFVVICALMFNNGTSTLGSSLMAMPARSASVLLGAIVEEIVYRGALYSQLRERLSRFPSTAIAITVVALGHGVTGWMDPGLIILNWCACELRERSGGIMAPICAHVAYNVCYLVL